MKKALSVTSPNHGMALAVYFFLGIFGLMGILGLTSTSQIVQSMGDGVGDIWSTLMMISSFGCFSSAMFASKAHRPEYHLRSEMWFATALAANLVFLMWVVAANFGPRGVISALLTLPFVAGAAIRAWQIRNEVILIAKARAHPEEAEPVMADPRDDERI